jgi:hypothetical protein
VAELSGIVNSHRQARGGNPDLWLLTALTHLGKAARYMHMGAGACQQPVVEFNDLRPEHT